MAVVDGRQDLLYYIGSIALAELLLFGYLIKKFSSIAQFCHQEVPFLILKKFIQFQNIRVI
jgi:hypothetical protein